MGRRGAAGTRPDPHRARCDGSPTRSRRRAPTCGEGGACRASRPDDSPAGWLHHKKHRDRGSGGFQSVGDGARICSRNPRQPGLGFARPGRGGRALRHVGANGQRSLQRRAGERCRTRATLCLASDRRQPESGAVDHGSGQGGNRGSARRDAVPARMDRDPHTKRAAAAVVSERRPEPNSAASCRRSRRGAVSVAQGRGRRGLVRFVETRRFGAGVVGGRGFGRR